MDLSHVQIEDRGDLLMIKFEVVSFANRIIIYAIMQRCIFMYMIKIFQRHSQLFYWWLIDHSISYRIFISLY